MKFNWDEDLYPVLLWLFLTVSMFVLLMFFFYNPSNEIMLPALMIFGVIALLASLSFVGKVFSKTNLACKEEALGLPSGSIRALIALSLIIIFAIMAVFLYNQLQPTTFLLQVPGNQSLVFSNGTIYTDPNGISIWTTETSQAQKDFSTQALTTVSTLVVALAGFYFGTKAVEAAKEKTVNEEEPLRINPSGKLKLKDKAPVHIVVNTNPKTEKVNAIVKGDPQVSKIEPSKDNSCVYIYTPSNDAKIVIIEFSLESNDKISDSLTIEF